MQALQQPNLHNKYLTRMPFSPIYLITALYWERLLYNKIFHDNLINIHCCKCKLMLSFILSITASTSYHQVPIIIQYLNYTGRFIMYHGITKSYYRKTVGHIFTKPVQIEGKTQNFFPSKWFFIAVHISAARRCECIQ